MKRLTALLAVVVLLAGCSQYQTSPSGLKYRINGSGNGPTLKHGQFVKFNIEYKVPPRDSVITTSFGHIPAYMMVDSFRLEKHSFLEIIMQCRVGDKVDFMMSVDTLKKMGGISKDDPQFKTGDMIMGRVEVLQAFATQDAAQADYLKEADLEKNSEIKEIGEYVAKKGYKVQNTPSGAMVLIENPGQGPKADSAMEVKMMYKGYLLKNGTEFDSNMKPGEQPLQVIIASQTNGVIKGLDEALRLFGKGGKGRVFIPAMLGYGPKGSPPRIPEYSNLGFDFEVLDVAPQLPVAPPSGPQHPR
jgi:FKBP-type peptidyl-prolyl cis-trans isomerase